MTDPKNEAERLEYLLSRYIDGDLDESERRDLEHRLTDDAGLSARLEEFRKTDQLAKRWARAATPQLDWERFARQAARRRDQYEAGRRRQRTFRLFASLSAAAAVVLAVTAYWAVTHPGLPGQADSSSVMVRVERGDAWKHSPDLGNAYASVSVMRNVGLQIIDSTASASSAAAVAAVAVLRPEAAQDEIATPLF